MSILTTKPFSKTQLISTTFIILFTFIFLLNIPLTSNPLTTVTTTTIPTRNNTSTFIFAYSNETEYRPPPASPLPPRIRVENKSNSCDVFDGSWVYDDNGPIYKPGSCPYVGGSFNCFKSGRPDFGYLNYRWQPHACDIPRFDGMKMLEMLRGKKMVFVGDSLNRNMWESLICSLSNFNVTGKRLLIRDGFSFQIKEYECSIIMITAPFIVKHWKTVGARAVQTPMDKLRIDEIHDTVANHYNADFLIFNTGQWWNPARTKNGENFFQEGDDFVHKKLEVEEAYTKAMNTWGKWVDNAVNKNKTKVFFVGLTAVHYKGGEWFSNGTCDKEKEPIKDAESIKGQVLEPFHPWVKNIPELAMSKMKTPVIYLNISRLTDFRKDGHPSRYRRPGSKWRPGVSQDCMHWCLPGVPDSWNQLLYATLLSSSKGTVV